MLTRRHVKQLAQIYLPESDNFLVKTHSKKHLAFIKCFAYVPDIVSKCFTGINSFNPTATL